MFIAPRVNLMNEALVDRFIQLISRNTGLYIREEDKKTLSKKISQRIKTLKISNPEDYYLFLTNNNEIKNYPGKPRNWTTEAEWKELVCLITTGESYFFRDQGQFSLLRNTILPEIITHKQNKAELTGNHQKSLRIWSAGCSTGEEPYSLAILVKQLIPDLYNWQILVLGTDINYKSIEKAKQGIYNPWSFRLVDPHLQIDYFQQQQSDWQIDNQITQMVKLQPGNLLLDKFPDYNAEIHDMDLILCRNVFVYFEHQAIATVVKKFYDTLVPGGYLMTAHTELYSQDMGEFKVKILPESIIYQRRENQLLNSNYHENSKSENPNLHKKSSSYRNSTLKNETGKYVDKSAILKELYNQSKISHSNYHYSTSFTTSKATEKIADHTPSTYIHHTSSHNLIKEAETLFQEEYYLQAIHKAEQVISSHPQHFGAHYLLAQAYANLGEHNQAVHYCQQAIAIDSLAVQPYYLLAHIAEENQDLEKAKLLLKTIIYLSPSFVAAYLELAAIYEKEGNQERAKKMLATALELLNQLPSSAVVEQHSAVTVGELLEYVKKLL